MNYFFSQPLKLIGRVGHTEARWDSLQLPVKNTNSLFHSTMQDLNFKLKTAVIYNYTLTLASFYRKTYKIQKKKVEVG